MDEGAPSYSLCRVEAGVCRLSRRRVWTDMLSDLVGCDHCAWVPGWAEERDRIANTATSAAPVAVSTPAEPVGQLSLF